MELHQFKRTMNNKKQPVEPEQAEHTYALSSFDGVHKYKSVWRAMRRGNVSASGVIYPHRPFNNSKATIGRRENENRKVLYFLYKENGRK